MKVRDIIAAVKAAGWVHENTEGSHRQFAHLTKPGKVTISGKPNDDVHPKTLKSIKTQAGI